MMRRTAGPHGMQHSTRQRARRAIGTAAIGTLVLAGCEIPYDFDGTGGADFVYVDQATWEWRDLDQTAPIWAPPATGGVPVPGDYDGDGQWEPAVLDYQRGVWSTAGDRGTFTFPITDVGDPSTGVRTVPVPGDYDGDGDTDPAYFAAKDATWHIEGQAPFVFGRPATDPPVVAVSNAILHDIAAPADYDGDGDTDPAVYRAESGDIRVLGQGTIATGMTYGFPVPANYTPAPGDEAAVLSLSGQGWVVEGEALPTSFAAGVSRPWPAPADYDGDGTVERAYVVVTATTRTWQVEGDPVRTIPAGSGGTVPVQFPPALRYEHLALTWFSSECSVRASNPTCPGEDLGYVTRASGVWTTYGTSSPWTTPAQSLPVIADYDGNGARERAAYDGATGQWITAGGRGTFTFAAPPDIDADPTTGVYPVPHDYDGDGDTDPAFYRDADATWHLEGQAPIQFGRATTSTPTFGGTPVHDIPIPGDYDGDGDTDLAVYRIDTGEIVSALGTADPGWPTGEPATADYDGDGDDDPGLYDQATGNWHRGGLPTTNPFGAVAGMPLPANHNGNPAYETGLISDGSPRRWRVPGVPLNAQLGGSPTVPAATSAHPTLGRHEVLANHAFVQSYLAACVAVTPPPGDCT